MDGVSPREREVLALVGEQLGNAEIARRLFISVRTVESHVSSLLRKLDAPDRAALARLAAAGAAPSDGAVELVGAPRPFTSFVGRAAAEEVIEESAIEFEHEVEDTEEVVDKFKEFLDEVTPEDFAQGDS